MRAVVITALFCTMAAEERLTGSGMGRAWFCREIKRWTAGIGLAGKWISAGEMDIG